MLTEQECKTALLQSIIIWEATKDEIFKADDLNLDFASHTKRQQIPIILYLDCVINKAVDDERLSLHQKLDEIIDKSVFDVYFPVIKFSLESYCQNEELDKDLKLHQGQCQVYEKKIQAIIDATPMGLPKITESLDADNFELLVLLVMGYSKYEPYGNSMQQLICYMDVVLTSRDLFDRYSAAQSL